MYQTRKIGVVGQGHVGAHVANSLLMQGIADELYLCDINEAKVTSEVQDLRDSLSFVPYNTKIVNCYDHYEELACCDVIVNAAGKVALAAGNRDGELFFTTDAARTFAWRFFFKMVRMNLYFLYASHILAQPQPRRSQPLQGQSTVIPYTFVPPKALSLLIIASNKCQTN